MKDKKSNGIKYNNGLHRSGKIDDKMREWHKKHGLVIPACDTVYLRLEKKGQDTLFMSFTYDELAGLVMILAETVWYNMPRKNRYKKGHQNSKH